MNTPVNFELAKLLKEKGYRILPDFKSSYPTIAEVVMWLYEKHGIWISVDWTVFFKEKVWFYSIRQKNQSSKLKRLFNSPTEAYEAAITYTLTKLI